MRWTLITWFGLGYLRPAPGTWGSAGACLAWGIAWLFTDVIIQTPPPLWLQTSLLLAGALWAYITGVRLGNWALAYFRANPPKRRSYGKTAEDALHDPGPFVLDEVAGQWLALAFVPADSLWTLLAYGTVAFLAFRAFDIAKPYPADRLERLPRGWGICSDDMLAGLYAGIVSLAFIRLAEWAIAAASA